MEMLTLEFAPTEAITACQLAKIIATVGINLQPYVIIKRDKYLAMPDDLKQFFTGDV